jgi:uncharacterized protein (TIGR03437 family)
VPVTLTGTAGAAPTIAVSVTSLAFSANMGAAPAPQTFTIRNSGAGSLNYQITATQRWINVAPESGASTGAANTVTVSLSTADLGAGTHDGDIRISQTETGTTPVTIAVRLTLNEVKIFSAASLALGGPLAPDSIGVVSAPNLAAVTAVAVPVPLPATPLPTSLGGVTVAVRDNTGTERLAQLFSVEPGQIRYLMPRETAPGPARLTVTSRDVVTGAGPIAIEAVAPGLFSSDASGRGAALAVALRIKPDGSQGLESVFRCVDTGGPCETTAIDLGPETDQVVLLLFGTGIRGFTAPAAVTASIGGEPAEVLAAAPLTQFAGVDQANVRLSRTLAGRGEVNVTISVDSRTSNAVAIRIQ